MKRTPMKRSQTPIKRSLFNKKARKRRLWHNKSILMTCKGQECFLAIDGVCKNRIDTVVPCHANWSEYGKSKGRKADDIYTVPGCFECHYELDQGKNLSKQERKTIWERAYARWSQQRDSVCNQ